MNSERWEQIEKLFHSALELDPGQRVSYLRSACDDDEILSEVEALLAHDDVNESFMESPAIELAARELVIDPRHEREIPTQSMSSPNSGDTPADIEVEFDALAPGRLIGNYKIVRKIGAGGMGEVYLAEDQKLQRRVAIKLLPSVLGVASEFVQRFHREARAASALNHPNIVTIYSIDNADGLNFIEMEYVEGETLKEKFESGPLDVSEVLEIGRQIAAGMHAAHQAGIIHRDLKPGNLLLTPAGRVKIVDFGLAKMMQESVLADAQKSHPTLGSDRAIDALSQAGSISGTVPYMSPEQTRGMELDARTDIFSLGCVLYEALTGKRPFNGETSRDIIDEILTRDPVPFSQVRRGLPTDVDRIAKRTLSKDKTQRYQSAAELENDLQRAIQRRSFRKTIKRLRILFALVLMVGTIGGWWWYRREANRTWASDRIPEIRQLLEKDQFFAAYDLANQVKVYISDDPQLIEMEPGFTDILTIVTDPPGASVFLQRYQKDASGRFPPRERIGVTPIEKKVIARGDYLLTLEKTGYVSCQRIVSSAFDRSERGLWELGKLRFAELAKDEEGNYEIRSDSLAPIELDLKLFPQGTVPDRMVYVPGGSYILAGAHRVILEPVPIDDFWIDRYEVTNREYKEFVDARGYERREFWTEPFYDHAPSEDREEPGTQARQLTWEEAMSRFTDLTGSPGPSGWTHRTYPKEEGDHPVTGVSWYEAAAYANFRGKKLPTVFQWEKAARNGEWSHLWGSLKPWGLTGLNEDLTDRANINGGGTVPVGRYPFGMSLFGCEDMCGNATEWCLNPRTRGYATSGGSWQDGPHLFGPCGHYPGFYRSETLGFRCAKTVSSPTGDQGAMPLPDVDQLVEINPVSEDVFRQMKTHYEYDRKPLDAEVIETVETDDWRRLKIRYVGANGQRSERRVPLKERALAYLWLPKNANPPYQIICYKPGGASYAGVTVPQETEVVCGPFLKAGWGVYVVVIEGMRERDLPPDWKEPAVDSIAYRDMLVKDTLDQRIGLDYLAQRNERDIDLDRIACMALSMGGYDLIVLAVDERIRATFFLSAGIWSNENRRMIPEAAPVNFGPYIRGPKLMIHGRYDEGLPLESTARPLFNLLSEPKEMHVLDTGHFPPIGQWYPIAQEFFDRTLDSVKLKQQTTERNQ